jgi:hypothetical protein
LDAYRQLQGTITIAQVEGIVRQVLGWREYIRCMYRHLMPEFDRMNYFEHNGLLPDFYWAGRTKMRCPRLVIDQSLDYACAHHIQGLMVTGNFALLIGVAPAAHSRPSPMSVPPDISIGRAITVANAPTATMKVPVRWPVRLTPYTGIFWSATDRSSNAMREWV